MVLSGNPVRVGWQNYDKKAVWQKPYRLILAVLAEHVLFDKDYCHDNHSHYG